MSEMGLLGVFLPVFVDLGLASLVDSAFVRRDLNFSTRPAVSISFSFPV